MALPSETEQTREDKLAARRAAEQDVLLREVDEAVRQDEVGTAVRKWGVPAGIAAVVALAGFGGWLLWAEHRESRRETKSETLVTAYDLLEADRVKEAAPQLTPLAKDAEPAAAASAKLALAIVASRENRIPDANKHLEELSADASAPQPYRDLATIRLVSAQFSQLKPEQVITRLKPLATPGNPWFGSAGELVAMAYMAQNRNDLAGPLLAAVAKDTNVPQTIRARTRQLAGLLGFDAVVDVDQTLGQLQSEQQAPAAPPPAP